jgi:Mg-chelatase subunit ChlD
MRLELTLRLNADPTPAAGVAFQITDPRSPGVQRRIPSAPGTFFPLTTIAETVDFTPTPPGSAGLPAPTSPDSAYMQPPPAVPPSDPNARRFKMFVELLSDYVFGAGGSIDSTLPGNESWTIDIELPPAVANQVASVCVQSYKFGTSLGDVQKIVLPATGAFVENVDNPTQSACESIRPGIDVVLVLDKSGSMASSTLGGAPRPKIEALRDAVLDFVQAWQDVRTGEGIAAPADRLGVVLFDSTASWWPTVSATGLADFTAAAATITAASLNTNNASGSTSIGAGLLLADSAFGVPDPTRRRVVLVMSNGQQNTDPLAGVTPAVPPRVFTHTSTTATGPDLPHQDEYQIYAVTVGTGAAVSAQINEDIASATNGFYINSEISAESLRTFFIELLQNFVRFNTWETARLVAGQVQPRIPFETSFPISSTTARVAIQALWPARLGQLRMLVAVPGEATPLQATGQGAIRLSTDLPTSSAYDPLGLWRVAVVPDISIIDVAAPPASIPIELTVLADDRAINASLSIVPTAYVPGDNIQLQAALTEFGRPLLGLGTRPGETVVAQVLKPGVSVGDLLAGSTASTTPAPTGDAQTTAEAKLYNELQQNPGGLVQAQDLVQLLDNGRDANGDARAGDGVYSGLYPAREPGHYTFLFGVQGQTSEAGDVSRQQVKSVFVRAIPDGSTTQAQATVQVVGQGRQLSLVLTPTTRFNNRLGPGFANYLWLTSPGVPPFKPVDNLDGTYGASLAFTGLVPPPVSLHFLPVSIVIGDGVPPEALPLPLDGSTTVIPVVPGTGLGGAKGSGCLVLVFEVIARLLRLVAGGLEALIRWLRP